MQKFFSLGAGEANWKNDWTKEFLAGWDYFDKMTNVLTATRENISIEEKWKDYFEPKSKELIAIQNEKSCDDTEAFSFSDLPKKVELFGLYQSTGIRKIFYFEKFYKASEEIKHIVRIHERMHAFHHVNYSYDVWNEFNSVSPVYLEFLAQLFTFKCVKGTYLEQYFKNLSKQQPFIYTTWQYGEHLSDNEILEVYLEIKSENTCRLKRINSIKDAYTIKSSVSNINSISPNIYLAKEVALLQASESILQDPYCIENINFKELETVAYDKIIHDLMTENITELFG